ncbi:MAG: hypothetical protein H6814_11435 [Phycisphaeraceae bacterium]|nr:hypothetical protein [Phycisphaeraceae bacterium]
MNDRALVSAWLDAARDDAVVAVLEAIYDYAVEAIAQRGPVCNTSGRCCRFEQYGHRLYVTGLEAAYTCCRLTEEHPACNAESLAEAVSTGGCPFQIDNLCAVHPIRPLGCRLYFCDPVAQGWQEAISEKLLAQIRGLHETNGVPYRYGEWRAMLGMFAD